MPGTGVGLWACGFDAAGAGTWGCSGGALCCAGGTRGSAQAQAQPRMNPSKAFMNLTLSTFEAGDDLYNRPIGSNPVVVRVSLIRVHDLLEPLHHFQGAVRRQMVNAAREHEPHSSIWIAVQETDQRVSRRGVAVDSDHGSCFERQ